MVSGLGGKRLLFLELLKRKGLDVFYSIWRIYLSLQKQIYPNADGSRSTIAKFYQFKIYKCFNVSFTKPLIGEQYRQKRWTLYGTYFNTWFNTVFNLPKSLRGKNDSYIRLPLDVVQCFSNLLLEYNQVSNQSIYLPCKWVHFINCSPKTVHKINFKIGIPWSYNADTV